MRTFRAALAATFATGMALSASPALAAFTFQTSLLSPLPPPGTVTPVAIQGAPVGSAAPVNGTGFTVNFGAGISGSQGIVQGAAPGLYAIPVAGATGAPPAAQYLTGDFGSALTTDPNAAGKYFSTGNTGFIEIVFDTSQRGFALLWGSVDTSNKIEFFNGNTSVGQILGSQIQSTPGFVGDGSQGPGGSVYVRIGGVEFNRVVATSDVVSFEFAGSVGAERGFGVPTPMSLAMFGIALAGLGVAARRRPAA